MADKGRAQWSSNPHHELILVEALLNDPRASAEDVMAMNFVLQNKYTKDQVGNKLSDIKQKHGATTQMLVAYEKRLRDKVPVATKKADTKGKKAADQAKLQESKRKAALNLKERLSMAGIFEEDSDNEGAGSDSEQTTGTFHISSESSSSSNYQKKPSKKKIKSTLDEFEGELDSLTQHPVAETSTQIAPVFSLTGLSSTPKHQSLAVHKANSTSVSPSTSEKAPSGPTTTVEKEVTLIPEMAWFNSFGRKNLILFNLSANADARLAMDKDGTGNCRIVIKRNYDGLIFRLQKQYQVERVALPKELQQESEVCIKFSLPSDIPRNTMPQKDHLHGDCAIVWRFDSTAIATSSSTELWS